jgi:hypothetical protein
MREPFYLQNPTGNFGPRVDVVVLCHPEDADKLPGCIESIRRNFKHDIASVKVISPRDCVIQTFCGENGIEYIDEERFSLEAFEKYSISENRVWPKGWIWQQLIKLQIDLVCTSDYIYMIDVDTRIMEPINLFQNKKVVLLKSEEWHTPYFDFINRILPGIKISNSSFVTHQMLVKSSWLKDLRKELESSYEKDWVLCILETLDFSELNPMSEFELIGTWAMNRHANEITQGFWFGDQVEKESRFKALLFKTRIGAMGQAHPTIFKSVHNREKWRKNLPGFSEST